MSSDLASWTASPPDRWNAFYVRVTQEESGKADLSVPNQIMRAHEIATARGWAAYQIYVEPRHVSGELWIDKRPALKRLVEDIRASRVTRVCARHTDRLWRTGEIQSKLLPILRSHNVELWDYANQHDYRSAHGRFSLQVLGAASELEVNLTAERIREMKRGKARSGKPGGGPPPFGYTAQSRRILELRAAGDSADEAYTSACLELPVGKRWYVDEQEAEIVRLIFQLYTGPEHRLGSLRIAQWLNARGYRTRNGHAWLANYVRRVVDNPTYAGFTSYDETAYVERVASRQPRSRQQLFPGEHPPIITPLLWNQAQAIKVGENRFKRTHATTKNQRVFSLTGFLHCPACASRMKGKWAYGPTRSYYICSRRSNGGLALCSFPLLDAQQLHAEVWRWIHEVVTSPPFVLPHLERLTRKLAAEKPEMEKRTSQLGRRRVQIQAALAKYYGIFESSSDPTRDQALMERVQELRGELRTVAEQLAEVSQKVVPLRRKLTADRVRGYLAELRAHIDARPKYQRTIFAEMKREHNLQVRVVSKHEAVVSIALPVREAAVAQGLAASTGGSRIYSVLAGSHIVRKSDGPGSPEPGPMDHAITIEHRFRLGRGSATAADWAEAENAKGRVCACGCGGRIRVLARHRWHGVPRWLKAHHPMKMSKEVAELRAGGGMTSKEAARELGIGVTILIRVEGVAYSVVPRRGKRGMRVFEARVVARLRAVVR